MNSDIFLSYSHNDSAIARDLVALLENLDFRVWVDVNSVRANSTITEQTKEGIKNSRYFALLSTENTSKSVMVNEEGAYYVSLQSSCYNNFIELKVRDGDPPLSLEKIIKPSRIYIDFRESFFKGLNVLISELRDNSNPIMPMGSLNIILNAN